MRCTRLVVPFITGLLFALPAPAQIPALKGLDPVALCAGKEEAGKAELTATAGEHRYQFASEANRAQFTADPARFAIQLGGACARMGPTSGQGDAQRWHVHKERIYIFASDQCREAFKKDGDRFLDIDEPRPAPDAAAAAAAATLLARAVAAHGGRDRIAALRSYRHEHAVTKGAMTEQRRLAMKWPAGLRVDHDYLQGEKSWRYGRVIDGEQAFFVEMGKGRTMGAEARLDTLRDLGREPLLALRAAIDGAAVAVAAGKREVLGATVEELAVWQYGRTTFLGLNEAGNVVTARFRGRGPGSWFGAVELRFTDFQETPLMIATSVRGTFDGKDEPSFTETRTGVAVDSELAADLFVRPKQ